MRAREAGGAREGAAGPRMRRWGVPTVVTLALALAVYFVATARPTVVFESEGAFGPVRVVEKPDGLMELYIGAGRSRQSAVYPRFPDRLVLDYTRVAMVGPALAPPDARILFVGLGGGAMPRYVRRALPDADIDVVEIDPVVVEAARQWFGFATGARLRLHVADGRPFVEAAPPGRWDLIVLDAFSDTDIPVHLTTREFLQAVRASLAPGGVVVANLPTGGAAYASMLATYAEVFEERALVDVAGRMQEILLAGGPERPLDREALLRAAGAWAPPGDPDHDLAALVDAGHRPFEPPAAPVLVDDAPGGA